MSEIVEIQCEVTEPWSRRAIETDGEPRSARTAAAEGWDGCWEEIRDSRFAKKSILEALVCM